jgi:hypothetical protein
LAKFHRLAVPINKDAGWLFKTMTKWVMTTSYVLSPTTSEFTTKTPAL